jgi:chromosome partitioning protein
MAAIASDVRPNLSVAVATLRMTTVERQLYTWGMRVRALSKALATLNPAPDVVVVDTPPSLGAFTESALHVADLTLAPVPALAGSIQGFGDLREAWVEMQDGKKGMLAAVINLLDSRTTATNAGAEQAIAALDTRILKTRISKAEVVNQAALSSNLVFDSASTHPVAGLFRELAAEAWTLAGKVHR